MIGLLNTGGLTIFLKLSLLKGGLARTSPLFCWSCLIGNINRSQSGTGILQRSMNHGPGFKGFVTCLQSGHRHQLEVGAHNITYLGVSNPSETHLFLVIYRFYFIVVT